MQIKSYDQMLIETDKPWVIVGKGPTFQAAWDLFESDSAEHYYMAALNEASTPFVRDGRREPDVVFINDFEGWLMCDRFALVPRVCMPTHPHYNGGAQNCIEFFLEIDPRLGRLNRYGTLFLFDLHSADKRYFDLPVVDARLNVAETAIEILARMGVKDFLLAGVDSSSTYHERFQPQYFKPFAKFDYSSQRKRIDGLRDRYGLNIEMLDRGAV